MGNDTAGHRVSAVTWDQSTQERNDFKQVIRKLATEGPASKLLGGDREKVIIHNPDDRRGTDNII